MAISNSDFVIQNFILNSPEFTFAFCNCFASISCSDFALCMIVPRLHVGFLSLPSVIILPRFPVAFSILSFAFCNMFASIPCGLILDVDVDVIGSSLLSYCCPMSYFLFHTIDSPW